MLPLRIVLIVCVLTAFAASWRTWNVPGSMSDGSDHHAADDPDASGRWGLPPHSFRHHVEASEPGTPFGQETHRIRLESVSYTSHSAAHDAIHWTVYRCRTPVVEKIKIQVKRVSMADYEAHHYDKETLQAAGEPERFRCTFRAAIYLRNHNIQRHLVLPVATRLIVAVTVASGLTETVNNEKFFPARRPLGQRQILCHCQLIQFN